ncbi:hypothetical protein pphageT12_26 [Pseudomonas phage pphageT12]|uniref:HNH nuclease domain-containing protein n=1 Tax=Pseudomonas phage phiB1_1 TaxID=2755402 RepID=A0A7D7FQ11_9CAUD|nr:hypothetical protein phiB1_1_18 [Pseudomonas phage phiB1_1]UAW53659.1 hypothetical protein pphageB21_26 [Pseudomonas phage pphageB21]UAW53718.1 hypothetical protein pphageT21_26 [Pseudomonas phage pphageT21]UAW53777.1 hypothetical protein pphageT12_26 [Pseudomonas phage pphageT12]UAW53837.1 hypothetical protein pphageBV72_25 [Pseudomonas phage pphageBV72]
MDIKYLYENTELTQQHIAAQLGIHWKRVFKFIKANYSAEFRKARKAKCYRNSKLGTLNPMRGKCGEQHHYYVGQVSDNKGYLMQLKPSWYTGRRNSKHVFVHHVVVCAALGITRVPAGWCVHHADRNPLNNEFGNLVLCTMGDHTRIHHQLLAGATTISKESTLKWVEAHGTPWRHDIV